MRFLSRHESEPAAAVVAEQPRVTLDQIAVFRTQGITEGWIELTADRLSDTLNAGAALRVRLPADDALDERWEVLRGDGVIALAVAPHPQPSPRRIARRRHAVELVAPPYTFTGTAYMPPGADPGRYARSTHHQWLALTHATVRFAGEVIEVEVLLVNLDHAHRL